MKTVIVNGEQHNVEENLDDILSYHRDIDFVSKYGGYYYIRLKPEHHYDEAMWKVDIKTGEASYIHLIDYMLDIEDKAMSVDPETIRRAS